MGKVLNNPAMEDYPRRIFANQLITLDDLYQFQTDFFEKLNLALKPLNIIPQKKWLKSHEVRRMLKISPGTLHTLKITGVLPYSKMGGVHFFDADDIQRILQKGKIQNVRL